MITFEQIINHLTEKVTTENLNNKNLTRLQQGVLKNIEGLKSTDEDYESKFNEYVSEFYNDGDLFADKTYEAENQKQRQQILEIITPVASIIKIRSVETKKEGSDDEFEGGGDSLFNEPKSEKKKESTKKHHSSATKDKNTSERGSDNKDDDSSIPETLSEEETFQLKKQLELYIKEISIFSTDSRLNLMALVDKYPKLLKDLRDHSTLALFVKKSSSQNLQYLEHGLNEEDIQALQRENERLANFEAIFNPAIALALAGIPTLSLSPEEVDRINGVLSNYPQESTLSEEEFKQLLIKVATATGSKVSYLLFKDNCDKDAVSDHQIFNKFFYKSYQKAKDDGDEFSKRLLAFYLTSPKKDSFAENPVANLLLDFENSSSREEFLKQLADKGAQDFFLRPISNLITPTLYNELKTLQHKEKLLNPETYEDVLVIRRSEMEERSELIKPIIDANKGFFKSIGKNLKFLADLEEIPWANPVFQATSQQLAHKWSKSFNLLAEDCNSIVEELTKQRNALKLAKAELPTPQALDKGYLKSNDPNLEEQGRQIWEYAVKVSQQLKIVEKELALYKKVLKKLQGDPASTDPLLREGIVALLKKAKEHSVDIEFHSFSTSIKDVLTGEVNDEVNDEAAPEAVGATSMPTGLEIEETQGDRALYRERAPLKEGFTRIHTLRSDSLTGRFLETRSSTHLALQPNAKGKVEAISKAKYEIDQFPTYPRDAEDPQLLSPEAQYEEDKARLKFAIKMATDALGNLNGPPTEKKPVVIFGENEEQAQFLWTALMIIGKHDPHMKFGAEAIKIDSACDFNPAKEMKGSFLGLGKNRLAETSLYKRLELEHDLEKFCAAIKQVNEAKFSPKACRKAAKVVENVEKVTNVYKDKLRTTIDNIASKNESRRSPSPLPSSSPLPEEESPVPRSLGPGRSG